jgi:hypothetical protein
LKALITVGKNRLMREIGSPVDKDGQSSSSVDLRASSNRNSTNLRNAFIWMRLCEVAARSSTHDGTAMGGHPLTGITAHLEAGGTWKTGAHSRDLSASVAG